MKILKKKVFRSWIWVIVCSLSIFLIVPVANAIQRFISASLGKYIFIYLVLAVLAIVLVSLLYFLIFKLNIRSLSNYIWLFIIAGLYTYFTLKLQKAPAEAIHFLEYGLLGFFLFRALSHHVRDKTIYLTATLFVLLVGTFDEILQWVTPGRYWSFRDVWLNILSGGLFQLGIWNVVRPKIISDKFSARSLKIFSSILVVCLIILGICVSNTPNRVASYTKHIPWLSFLQKEEPMSEFGYKLKDPEIGVFYSRLSPGRLQKTDKQVGRDYAQILNESVDKNYGHFLKEYSPSTHPFMHELRVHIFRRDEYFKKAKNTSDPGKKREFFFIAYKENLILKKYFTQSIEKSVYQWKNDIVAKSEALIDKNKSYESPVSANLFTSFSEKTVWIIIFSLIFFLVLVNVLFPFIKRTDKSR